LEKFGMTHDAGLALSCIALLTAHSADSPDALIGQEPDRATDL
jgi:hypothetical protein